MNSLLEWVAMGGYAAYVWSAYGLVLLALGLDWYWLKRQKVKLQQRLRQALSS